MSRLLTLGVLSQAGDPAKALADAYCAYVTLMGGVVDYATVYNIYKNEYLTDTDKELLTDWYDFRGGKLLYNVNEITSVWSLIYPYRKMQYVSTRPIINYNEYASSNASVMLYYNLGHYNALGYSMRQVTKYMPLASIATTTYQGLCYQQAPSQGCRATRCGAATDVAKVATILWYSATPAGGSIGASPTNTYPLNDIIVVEHLVNWTDRTNKIVVNGTEISSLIIDADRFPVPFYEGTGTAAARIYIDPRWNTYYIKHYKY